MEYRGYDSVGLATLGENKINVCKGVGKVKEVNKKLSLSELSGIRGIGHTRWATHGRVSDTNAHPHLSHNRQVAVVHNGIIENYSQLRTKLEGKGIVFESDTDTEVIPNLLELHMKETNNDIKESIVRTVAEIEGQYSFIALFMNGTMAAARFHEPLILGVGGNDRGNFVSSDILGFIEKTDDVIYIGDREFVIMEDANRFDIFDFAGNRITSHHVSKVAKEYRDFGKGGYTHFTLKEIYEQHSTIKKAGGDSIMELDRLVALFEDPTRHFYITGNGSSYYAGLTTMYLLSRFAGIRVEPIMASEVKYLQNSIKSDNACLIAISQSGESADVLDAVSIFKQKGCQIVSIVNSLNSSLAKESSITLGLHCGPEIGVAATKSFTSQLSIFYKVINKLHERKNIRGIVPDFNVISSAIDSMLSDPAQIIEISNKLRDSNAVYVMGKGVHYPIALEGALKIKELTYINSEGIAAGELKHGPLAMIDSSSYIFAIHPEDDDTYQQISSSISEAKSRGARIIGISNKHNPMYDYWVKIPQVPESTYPLIEVIVLQLFAYHLAVSKGKDPDYPRNLAKSVTVR
jgi:glucosamine--fructose-6-phosphate aminotransferase (isomerizing)